MEEGAEGPGLLERSEGLGFRDRGSKEFGLAYLELTDLGDSSFAATPPDNKVSSNQQGTPKRGRHAKGGLYLAP